MENTHTNKDYKLGSTLVWYTIMNDTGMVFLSIVC